jgi:DNA polymerase-1
MGAVIDWREMQKNRDSFCQPIIDKIPADGPDVAPVRCNLRTTTVATRRLAASDPNLLAIPTRNEAGLRVRDGFIAPDGETFGSWDLSQVEMRYMAHLSEDPLLIRFFKEKRDVHAETAARIFGIPLDKVNEMSHRYPAKRAAFGIITNITGAGLYDQLRMFGCKGWNIAKCDRLIEDWLGVYEGVARFLGECRDEAHRNGIVYDCWGMPRYLPGVWSDDPKVVADDERAASSHKIQGGAQGMIQNSMAWLKPYIRDLQLAGMKVTWRLQIHDEIILSFQEDLWDTLNELVVEALTKHHELPNPRVPITAKGSYAKTWGKLKA